MGEEGCLCIEAILENKMGKVAPFLESLPHSEGVMSGVSSEGPNLSDFGHPGMVEYRPRRPPSWPQRRSTGDGGRHTVVRFPSSRSCRGGRRQDGDHAVAPGSPDSKGCGWRGSWPLRGKCPLGRSRCSTGQQIPPGWQAGTSSSVHWGGPEG